MDSRYLIRRHNNAGNLYISICGEFNGTCAWELFKLVKHHNAGSGRIFVNTAGISRILADGVALFKLYLPRHRIPSDWLYFKGEKGFKIAPDGCRVLIPNKCGNRRAFIQKTQINQRKDPEVSRLGVNPSLGKGDSNEESAHYFRYDHRQHGKHVRND